MALSPGFGEGVKSLLNDHEPENTTRDVMRPLGSKMPSPSAPGDGSSTEATPLTKAPAVLAPAADEDAPAKQAPAVRHELQGVHKRGMAAYLASVAAAQSGRPAPQVCTGVYP